MIWGHVRSSLSPTLLDSRARPGHARQSAGFWFWMFKLPKTARGSAAPASLTHLLDIHDVAPGKSVRSRCLVQSGPQLHFVRNDELQAHRCFEPMLNTDQAADLMQTYPKTLQRMARDGSVPPTAWVPPGAAGRSLLASFSSCISAVGNDRACASVGASSPWLLPGACDSLYQKRRKCGYVGVTRERLLSSRSPRSPPTQVSCPLPGPEIHP